MPPPTRTWPAGQLTLTGVSDACAAVTGPVAAWTAIAGSWAFATPGAAARAATRSTSTPRQRAGRTKWLRSGAARS